MNINLILGYYKCFKSFWRRSGFEGMNATTKDIRRSNFGVDHQS